jgi:hypothetical protein
MYVYIFFIPIYLFHLKCRSETPPNTPQRARAAARQNERDNRNLNSPQHRRIPQPGPSHIPPLQLPIPPLQLPNPQPLPVPGNADADDPFGPPVQNISINCLSQI